MGPDHHRTQSTTKIHARTDTEICPVAMSVREPTSPHANTTSLPVSPSSPGAVGDRTTVQGAESPDRVRTTTTGTFADCATAAPTEPSGMPANPPRP